MATMADSATATDVGTNAENRENRVETIEQVERRRNHPLYLHNSDAPGSILTGTENYALWSGSMLINLRAKNKLGFVLGNCKRSDYRGELEE